MKIDNHSDKKKSRKVLDDEFSAAIALAHAAQAKAAKAEAKAAKARAEAERATEEAIRKGESLQERTEKDDADTRAADPHVDRHECSIHSSPRELLVKALGMLGSDQAGERASAALVAEKQRAKLDQTWDQLIVREDDDDGDFDDDDDDDEDLGEDDDEEPAS